MLNILPLLPTLPQTNPPPDYNQLKFEELVTTNTYDIAKMSSFYSKVLWVLLYVFKSKMFYKSGWLVGKFPFDEIFKLQILVGSPLSLNIRNLAWHGFLQPGEIPPNLPPVIVSLIASIGGVIKVKCFYQTMLSSYPFLIIQFTTRFKNWTFNKLKLIFYLFISAFS